MHTRASTLYWPQLPAQTISQSSATTGVSSVSADLASSLHLDLDASILREMYVAQTHVLVPVVHRAAISWAPHVTESTRWADVTPGSRRQEF